MKTIELTLFKFSELSESAKETAIQEYANDCQHDIQFIYDDAHKTVTEFVELFGLKGGSRSWLDFNTNNIDDYIVSLKGLRLRKYLINNYWDKLYQGKFRASIGDNKVIKHRNIKTNYYDMSKGALVSSSNFYYSTIFFECSCPLTGMCYDMDILDPILNIINNYNPKIHENMDFEDIINECSSSIRKTLKDEEEYIQSEEYIKELLSDNSDEIFYEDGTKY